MRLLCGNDVEHVFFGQRFKVEPVRRIVVGGHGFGIAVDHDRLEPGITQRERRVHAAVVELDALSDAVRPRTEDDDLLGVGLAYFVLVFVCRVVIRGFSGELRSAGVNSFVRRNDTSGFASSTYFVFGSTPLLRQLHIRKAESLGPLPVAG